MGTSYREGAGLSNEVGWVHSVDRKRLLGVPGIFPEERSLAMAQGVLRCSPPRDRGIHHLGQAGTRKAAPFLCRFCCAPTDGEIAQLVRPQASGKAFLTLQGVISA